MIRIAESQRRPFHRFVLAVVILNRITESWIRSSVSDVMIPTSVCFFSGALHPIGLFSPGVCNSRLRFPFIFLLSGAIFLFFSYSDCYRPLAKIGEYGGGAPCKAPREDDCSARINPSFGLLNLFGRLARRPKVYRRLARRRWFGNIYIGAAGKLFDTLTDLIIGS